MARIETALTRLFGIEHPILTAPMSVIAGSALANPAPGCFPEQRGVRRHRDGFEWLTS